MVGETKDGAQVGNVVDRVLEDGGEELQLSDAPLGQGWWIASDGRWYPRELHPDARGNAVPTRPDPPGPGWWKAADGNWYPPELHPEADSATIVRPISRRQSEPPAVTQFASKLQEASGGSGKGKATGSLNGKKAAAGESAGDGADGDEAERADEHLAAGLTRVSAASSAESAGRRRGGRKSSDAPRARPPTPEEVGLVRSSDALDFFARRPNVMNRPIPMAAALGAIVLVLVLAAVLALLVVH